MTFSGFWLTRLTIRGPGVPVAEVQFRKGLNVVSGPSDTGKTYIAQCIDFMLGASTPPKDIPEAASYDLVSLGLRANSGDAAELVLERSLRGGDLRLWEDSNERVLGAKHQPDNKNTVSHFLLELAGLAGRKIRTNKQGKTRLLSYRDIARLTFVDEETVISEKSPIFSGQYINRTVESSVFRLMLTGVDDSSIVQGDNREIMRSQQEAKTEVLDYLLSRARAQLDALELGTDSSLIPEQMDRIEALFHQTSAELQVEQQTIADIEERRRGAWTSLRQVESRLDVLSELQRRFRLLKEQYSSDLRRLEAISEAALRLRQMKEERCPVCGALAEHHDREHQKPYATPEEVGNACRAEANKIHALLTDLESTLSDNANEVDRLTYEREQKRAELDVTGNEIRSRIEPRIRDALQKLRDSQVQRDKYRRAFELYEHIEELERMRGETALATSATLVEAHTAAVGADEAEQFSKEMEVLLRSWHFPNLDRVTFSEQNQDVVISGQQRSSHGKGVRAITHAAFSLALLRYCIGRSMPHPGIVVIDSPLVVYREPDIGEDGFTPHLKDSFYRTLARDFTASQVIILENEDPPDDLSNAATIIKFTGTKHGRRGFFPV